MSMIDVLTRVDVICKKYDKYDADKHRNDAGGGDAFPRLYASVDAEIDAAIENSERAAREKNRAATVALNADVRRTKARLMQEVPKLQKLAAKKVKGRSPEELAIRGDLVAALPHRIQSIPDGGSGGAADQHDGWRGGNAQPGIKFDYSAETFDDGYFDHSEESEQFRSEYEMRRMKQDEGLGIISEGLDTLKNLAQDMSEELDRQVPLMDEIDAKVDRAKADLKKTNVRLKETLTQFRSTRNFIVDIILLCVILGIAAYLYNVLNQ